MQHLAILCAPGNKVFRVDLMACTRPPLQVLNRDDSAPPMIIPIQGGYVVEGGTSQFIGF